MIDQMFCDFITSVSFHSIPEELFLFSLIQMEKLWLLKLCPESLSLFSVYCELSSVEFQGDREILSSIMGFKFYVH